MAILNPVRAAHTLVVLPTQQAVLRLVPDLKVAPGQRLHRVAFLKLMILVLTVGMAFLLVINTLLTQDAFTLRQLERQVIDISAQEESITQQAARQSSPAELAAKANALGMQAPNPKQDSPQFIDLQSGKILGGEQFAPQGQ